MRSVMTEAYAPKIPVNTNVQVEQSKLWLKGQKQRIRGRGRRMSMALQTQRSLLTGSMALEKIKKDKAHVMSRYQSQCIFLDKFEQCLKHIVQNCFALVTLCEVSLSNRHTFGPQCNHVNNVIL